jgi:hypothetical protein
LTSSGEQMSPLGLIGRGELKCVEVRVFQQKTEAHRLTREFAQVAGFPGDDSVELVAKNFIAVLQREARNGSPVGRLEFNPQTAGRRGGEVQFQFFTGKRQWLGDEFPSREGRMDRDKPIDTQCVTPQMAGSHVVEVMMPRTPSEKPR